MSIRELDARLRERFGYKGARGLALELVKRKISERLESGTVTTTKRGSTMLS